MAQQDQNELLVRDPELPRTPGWLQLSREKQESLLHRTSNIKRFQQMEGLGAIGACLELVAVERELEGEKMTITNYVKTIYGQSERTAWRRLAQFKELNKRWRPKVIEAVAKNGALMLRGAAGIGLNELINIAKQLPAPVSDEEKVIEGFVMKDVREKLRERRSRNPEVVVLALDDSKKITFNYLLRNMRNAKMRTSEQKLRFLEEVVGWTMEAMAIPGVLKTKRISIPEDMKTKRGRPRNLGPVPPKKVA